MIIGIFPVAWASNHETVEGVIGKFQNEVLVPLISLIFVLATVIFLWGVLQYVVGSRGDDTKLKKGKAVMTWGIVGMAIMASAWGIVRVICNYFGTCAGSFDLRRTDTGVEEPRARRSSPEVMPGGSGATEDILVDDEFAKGSQPSGGAEQPPREINLGGDNIVIPEGRGSYLFRK